MEESFIQKCKEYFYFLKKDRNGVLILIILILLMIGGHFIIEKIQITPHADITEMIQAFEAWESQQNVFDESPAFFYFDPNTASPEQLDSLSIPDFIKNNILKYRSAGGSFHRPTDLIKIYGMNDSIYALIEPWVLIPYVTPQEEEKHEETVMMKVNMQIDPNNSTAEELRQLGFNSFQISNLEKYRQKGGRFFKPEDLLKIYGVDSIFFLAIKENIRMEEIVSPSDNEIPRVNTTVNSLVELNAADSLTLIQMKGIGPVFASRIIKYRNLLGGFYSTDQLLEVYGFPEETFYELKDNFTVDSLSIKKLRINFAEYIEMIRHPYIEKENVEAVLKYRNRNGPFESHEQLVTEGIIDSVTYARIKPYITCR